MTQTDPPPTVPARIRRSIRRIIAETVFIALMGGLVLGIFWECFSPEAGWIAGAVVWIIGDPILEIARVVQERHGG